MKSRPMIFSAPMVRAILAGQKTQTRRVVKDESLLDLCSEWPDLAPHMGTSIEDGTFGFEHVEYGAMCGEEHLLEPKWMVWQEVKCPYGVVGDRLWVREGYRQELNLGHDKNGNWPDADGLYSYFYKADCDNPKGWGIGVWKSPLHMPRAASRIELEITGIRIERVQDISEADARSEGITDGGCLSCGNPEPCGCCNPKPDARDSYIWLWHKTNGKKHPWDSNPWVWVVEFKRVDDCQNCVHANQGACSDCVVDRERLGCVGWGMNYESELLAALESITEFCTIKHRKGDGHEWQVSQYQPECVQAALDLIAKFKGGNDCQNCVYANQGTCCGGAA